MLERVQRRLTIDMAMTPRLKKSEPSGSAAAVLFQPLRAAEARAGHQVDAEIEQADGILVIGHVDGDDRQDRWPSRFR